MTENANEIYGKKIDEIVDLLLGLLSPLKGENILEIGCGFGYFANDLSKRVGSSGKVVAIDPSKHRISVAKELFAKSFNLEFVECSSTDFPLEILYDSCVCNKTLHWIKSEEKVKTFERIYSSLKPGGRFVGNNSFHMPKNVELMISCLPDSSKKYIEDLHDRENKEILQAMLINSGFEISYFQDKFAEYPIGNEDKFLTFMNTAFFDKFDFKDIYLEKKDVLNFRKDSSCNFLHDFNGLFFSVTKPV